jgi:cyclopropane-fatty-acyl-phospholipid synthase
MNTQTNILNDQSELLPWHAKALFKLLENLRAGKLNLVDPNGNQFCFEGTQPGLTAHIHIHNWSVSKSCLKSGDIGFAESYINGDWDSPDIESLLRLLLINRQAIEKLIYGSWWGSLFHRLKHWLNKNSKKGSKKNIHAHYDIGNSFYSLWLDQSMTYSSAFFDEKNLSLFDAQKNKYERIISSIGIQENERLLEVGCGWGGLMETAQRKNIAIDCLTISQEQAAYAQTRADQLSLTHPSPANIILQDYRDHEAQYDGIASIEMFEAVGEEYWPSYFAMINRCLKPGKKACIQTIVIAEDLFEKYRHNSDFIQQYIFPGGMLPSTTVFKKCAEDAGLIVEDAFSFGKDYQKTLEIWHSQFNSSLSEIKAQGFDEKFIRLWNLYLMYCAAGFAEESTDVIQFTLRKPA